MILYLLSLIGILTGFVCLTLAIASGLYYLSELVEEYSELTKRTLYRLIYTIISVLLLLWIVEGFPFKLTVFSIAINFLYLKTLSKFPYLKIDSPDFILSGILTFINHFLWFNHFNNLSSNRHYDNRIIPSFSEIASFFGICVWLIPFSLFISLSAGENLLPSNNNELDGSRNDNITIDGSTFTPTTFSRKSKGLIKEVINNIRNYIMPSQRDTGGII
ncbi:Svp26 protein [Saccharomycopsis crataegensis]|uniref:Svp26 protein n=1 Tax=Saccharomycopsis crataegensis TaxID=43959 RepID=A0AAV5QQ53_9ASCO|nr:Svp26 protein [Saccharomycopsis crataegensis]